MRFNAPQGRSLVLQLVVPAYFETLITENKALVSAVKH
jgi:hypothetical protein